MIFGLKNEWGDTHLFLLSTSPTADQTLHFPEQSEHSSYETEPSFLLPYGFLWLTELLWQTSVAIGSNLIGYKDGWGGKEKQNYTSFYLVLRNVLVLS